MGFFIDNLVNAMAENSKIEWTATLMPDGSLEPGHTANLWWGCTAVHAGCDHCYAEAWAKSKGKEAWGNDAPRYATKSVWKDVLRWNAEAHAAGVVKRVFVGSMMDIFEKPMLLYSWQGEPLGITTDVPRQRFFNEIIPGCQNLEFLLLTKRPSNINKYIPESWKSSPPKNVMFGTSVVNQETFENLTYHLKKVKGRRFLSMEPQLDWIRPTRFQMIGIDWVIQGGESGPKRRPFDLAWADWMKGVCADFNVPYFFKQIDKVQPVPERFLNRQFPETIR